MRRDAVAEDERQRALAHDSGIPLGSRSIDEKAPHDLRGVDLVDEAASVDAGDSFPIVRVPPPPAWAAGWGQDRHVCISNYLFHLQPALTRNLLRCVGCFPDA